MSEQHITETNPVPTEPAAGDATAAHNRRPPRVRRRRLVQGALATAAGAGAAAYVSPSLRRLEIATAHAFSF